MTVDRDPWGGLRPLRPPSELRTRVLAAAREAAAQPARSLFSALYHDRLLRVCAAGLATLLVVNVLVAAHGEYPRRVVPRVVDVDGLAIPGETGLTAAEQSAMLAPLLGPTTARRHR
jgi:hypothetical protein